MHSIFGDRKTIIILLGPALLLYTLLKILPVAWSLGLSFFEGNTLRGFIRDFRNTDEVILDREDLGPLFGVALAFGNIAAQAVRYRINMPEAFMFENEWDGRPLPN